MLGCSFASDFTHDNSDYQWFIDYGWDMWFYFKSYFFSAPKCSN
jgi:hypothetical protein